MRFSLRPYQEEGVEAVLNTLKRVRSCLVVIPTGGGKTILFAGLIRRWPGRAIVLAHRRELVFQNREKIKWMAPELDVRIEMGDWKAVADDAHMHSLYEAELREHGIEPGRNIGPDVIVATPQSLHPKRIGKLDPHKYDLLVVDECFPAGTLVDGKPIEEYRAGDRVWSFNHVGKRIEQQMVRCVFRRPAYDLVVVEFASGTWLTCTANHPIFDASGEAYVPAIDLKPGATVFWDTGPTPGRRGKKDDVGRLGTDTVVRVDVESMRGQRRMVYNLEVQNTNNYFADGILVHNCHHYAKNVKSFHRVLEHFQQNPDLKICGVSVAPQTVVTFFGGAFGDGFVGSVESAFQRAASMCRVRVIGYGHEVVDLDEVYSRGWDGCRFAWKPCRRIIRHRCEVPCSSVGYRGKRMLVATDAHAVYRAAPGRSVRVTMGRTRLSKKSAILECVGAADLERGDLLLSDTGDAWDGCLECPIDMLAFSKNHLRDSRVRVRCDVRSLPRSDLRSIGLNYKQVWSVRNHQSLALADYLALGNNAPPPTELGVEGSAVAVAPVVWLSEWAYFLGFWLGDGWVSQDPQCRRIALAVENSLVERIGEEMKSLSGVEWSITKRPMPGKSHELRANNIFVASILGVIFRGVRAWGKFIPGEWIVSWTEPARRNLLRGLLDSDGCVTGPENKRRCIVTTTSSTLADSLLVLLQSLGIQGSLSTSAATRGGMIGDRQIQGKRSRYNVGWSLMQMQGDNSGWRGKRTRLVHGSLNFDESSVRGVVPCEHPEFVYDLEMDGHPSFVANGILVHNSATPDRHDEVALGEVFDEVAYEMDILDDGINEGWLVSIDQQIVHVDGLDLSACKTIKGDFKDSELEDILAEEKMAHRIVSPTIDIVGDKKTLVFACSVLHAHMMAEIFNRHRSGCAVAMDHTTPKEDRAYELERFRKGEFQFLLNCSLFGEGYDEATIEAIVMARPTKSRSRYCLDSKTEILTRTGWWGIDRFDDIAQAEVACFHPETAAISWEIPSATHIAEVVDRDKMFGIESPGLDIRVTDNHSMLYRSASTNRHSSAFFHIDAFRLAERRSEYEMPAAGYEDVPGIPLTDAELRFVGWSMTDGTINKANGQITISQAAHQQWNADIEECLKGCGFRYGRHVVTGSTQFKENRCQILYTISYGDPVRRTDREKGLHGWRNLGRYIDKDVAPALSAMTRDQLLVMLEAIHMADGTKQEGQSWTRRSYHITKGNRRFADRLQALCVGRGLRCNVAEADDRWHAKTQYHIHIKDKDCRHVGGAGYRDRPTFSERLAVIGERTWCVTVSTSAIVTRRNGKVAIVGNSQELGRGTRVLPDVIEGVRNGDFWRLPTVDERKRAIAASAKKAILAIDFAGNSGKHKLIFSGDLLGGKLADEVIERARKITIAKSSRGESSPMTETLLLAREQIEQEAVDRRKKIILEATYRKRPVDPFQVFDVAPTREPGWHKGRKPSEKQVEFIKRAKIPVVFRGGKYWIGDHKKPGEQTELSFWRAHKIIDEIQGRRKKGLCTFAQGALLMKHGLNPDVTFKTASGWIDKIAKNGWELPPELAADLDSLYNGKASK